jgi:uncharacterized RDD family membrane protein YckC
MPSGLGAGRHAEGKHVLSTLPSQINAAPSSWKQEVNRRVAAHKNRKGPVRVEPEQQPATQRHASVRAAEAAARVASRFANAPSFNEILVDEARVVVRAAAAASRAAMQAQEAAQNVLAGLEAASAAEAPRPARGLQEAVAAPEPPAVPFTPRGEKNGAYSVHWDEEFAQRSQETAASANPALEQYEVIPEDWHEQEQATCAPEDLESEGIEVIEGGHPIPGNLIEFPRELVATRKVRPRLLEGPLAQTAEPETQLSIFEVDPSSISTVAEEPGIVAEEQTATWQATEWRGIELPAEPLEDMIELSELSPAPAPPLDPAPLSLRMMALTVNISLVTGAFLLAAVAALMNATELPSPRTVEAGSVMAVVLIALLYTAMFYLLGDGTPGMKYANLRLASFNGKRSTRLQRLGRLAGLVLSVLPLCLGLVWFVFDDERLCWHDRLSRTYLRRY